MNNARFGVSVVIPAYKAEKTIRRTIESVLKQPYIEPEIIVVVDGNIDGTVRVVESFISVRIVTNNVTQGAPKSRNMGLEIASCDYVMFLDADDYIEGACLYGLCTAILENKADLAFCPSIIEWDAQRRHEHPFPDFSDNPSLIASWLTGRYVPTCSVLWKRAFLLENGAWNEKVKCNQDGELVMRSLLKGARYAISGEGNGVYVMHDSTDRISKQPVDKVAPSQMAVLDSLLEQARLSCYWGGTLEAAFATAYYGMARRCYRAKLKHLGDACLGKARSLGLKGHLGDRRHQMIATLFGLNIKEIIANTLSIGNH